MSALGQKRTFCIALPMSALPPKADIGTRSRNVCFVPEADITQRAGRYSITLREVAGVLAKAPKKAGGRRPRKKRLRCPTNARTKLRRYCFRSRGDEITPRSVGSYLR